MTRVTFLMCRDAPERRGHIPMKLPIVRRLKMLRIYAPSHMYEHPTKCSLKSFENFPPKLRKVVSLWL